MERKRSLGRCEMGYGIVWGSGGRAFDGFFFMCVCVCVYEYEKANIKADF